MPRIIVVLGTGTDVGKTYFTVALARALGEPGHGRVLAVKPVETGFPASPGVTAPSDADRLRKASTARLRGPHAGFRFRPPVSPHLAARRAGSRLDPQRIGAWVTRAQNAVTLHDAALHWVLVETAGGAFSPLASRATNVDLASVLEPAIWILVAPDSLGVLHDVRATMIALRHSAREPDFVVLSAARPRDASTGTNAAELSRLGIANPIATLPRGAGARRALGPLVSALHDRARPRKARSR